MLFLQETYRTLATNWQLEWGDGVYFSHFVGTSFGMSMLFFPSL